LAMGDRSVAPRGGGNGRGGGYLGLDTGGCVCVCGSRGRYTHNMAHRRRESSDGAPSGRLRHWAVRSSNRSDLGWCNAQRKPTDAPPPPHASRCMAFAPAASGRAMGVAHAGRQSKHTTEKSQRPKKSQKYTSTFSHTSHTHKPRNTTMKLLCHFFRNNNKHM
jgi:hypothetical protein